LGGVWGGLVRSNLLIGAPRGAELAKTALKKAKIWCSMHPNGLQHWFGD
jgi:hypothetical protein